jgi:hypothetical protein
MLDALDDYVGTLQYLRQRFDELYDRAEMLRNLIRERGEDSADLRGMLVVADAEMKEALNELRAVRPRAVIGGRYTPKAWRQTTNGPKSSLAR